MLGLVYLFLALNLVAVQLHASPDGELRQAQKALNTGDYEKAFPLYIDAAHNKNNPLATFTIALFYDNGWGRPVDRAEACRWYEKAAATTIPAASHFHGECLVEGTLKSSDYVEAVRSFQQAANLGHYFSLCSLAELYVDGLGVEKNPAKGITLCQQAAEKGVVPAMTRLGRFYSERNDKTEGNDKTLDYIAAQHWFLMGAQHRSAESQFRLALMLRDGIGKPIDTHGATFWFEAAASQGYTPAYYPTATLYFHTPVDPKTGLWTEKNLAKAYLWLSATLRGAHNADEKPEAQQMLNQILEVMPKTWRPELDAKLTEHFTQYPITSHYVLPRTNIKIGPSTIN